MEEEMRYVIVCMVFFLLLYISATSWAIHTTNKRRGEVIERRLEQVYNGFNKFLYENGYEEYERGENGLH